MPPTPSTPLPYIPTPPPFAPTTTLKVSLVYPAPPPPPPPPFVAAASPDKLAEDAGDPVGLLPLPPYPPKPAYPAAPPPPGGLNPSVDVSTVPPKPPAYPPSYAPAICPPTAFKLPITTCAVPLEPFDPPPAIQENALDCPPIVLACVVVLATVTCPRPPAPTTTVYV